MSEAGARTRVTRYSMIRRIRARRFMSQAITKVRSASTPPEVNRSAILPAPPSRQPMAKKTGTAK